MTRAVARALLALALALALAVRLALVPPPPPEQGRVQDPLPAAREKVSDGNATKGRSLWKSGVQHFWKCAASPLEVQWKSTDPGVVPKYIFVLPIFIGVSKFPGKIKRPAGNFLISGHFRGLRDRMYKLLPTRETR